MPPVLGAILLKSMGIHTLTKLIKLYPIGRAEMVGMRVERMPHQYYSKKKRAVGKFFYWEGKRERTAARGTKFLWKIIHD